MQLTDQCFHLENRQHRPTGTVTAMSGVETECPKVNRQIRPTHRSKANHFNERGLTTKDPLTPVNGTSPGMFSVHVHSFEPRLEFSGV